MRTFEQFAEFVVGNGRLEGVVSVRKAVRTFQGAVDPVQEIDAFIASQGFTPLGQGWLHLGADEAVQLLEECLRKSLAYQVEMLPAAEARSVSSEFKSFFQRGQTRWFANGRRNAWSPITRSTFDRAIVVLDNENAGLFLFEDED